MKKRLPRKYKKIFFLSLSITVALIGVFFIYKKYVQKSVELFPINTSGTVTLKIKESTGKTTLVVGQEYTFQVYVSQAPSNFSSKGFAFTVQVPKSNFTYTPTSTSAVISPNISSLGANAFVNISQADTTSAYRFQVFSGAKNTFSLGTNTVLFTFKAKPKSAGTISFVGDAFISDSSKTNQLKSLQNLTITQQANQLPTVTLNTSQSSNTAPSNITLTATASDPDGSVTLVEFYNGSTKIGESTSNNNNTFTYTWSNRPQGTYNLKARAKDNTGAFGNYSAIKTVTVLAAPTPTPSLNNPPVISSISTTKSTYGTGEPVIVNMAIRDPENDRITSYFLFISLNGGQSYSPWGGTFAEIPISVPNPGVGDYRVRGLAYDSNGGRSNFSTSVAFSVSSTPPTPTPTPTPAPNRIPVIDSITLSSNNNYVDPTNVTITVSASDPDGSVSSVEFFNGSTKLFTDNSAPFRFTWNNRSLGNSTITVKAKDNDGAYSALSSKTFTVKAAPTPTPSPTPAPNQLPTVTLNTSQSSSTAPSNITLTATASDPDGSVTLVEFYNGSTKIGQATSNNNNNTFTYTWSNRPQGTYNLKARAKDNTGAFGNYSAIKTVTVLAAPTPTPLPSPSPSPTSVAPTATPTPDSPTPTPTPLPANKFDVTGDGVVDMSDIINVIRRLFGV